jgi:inorganic pyrophosphatase
MVEAVISIRGARFGDETGIARVHDEAWREAYRGVIPGRELERMIIRRGPAWWRRAIAGGTRLIVLDFADAIAGYASYGRNRMPSLSYSGEIFELYVAPEYQGGGLGRRMFEAAQRDLAAHGYPTFVVWALAGNDRAVGFYRRLGGRIVRRAPEQGAAAPREPAEPCFATLDLGAYPVNLQAVSIGENAPAEVNVVIEVPIGGEPIKYEMDKASGALKVDRFLYTSMRYPGNYGFIPHTLSDDGDPCDVIVANTRAIVPGAFMSCRIVGVLLEDEAGGDEKLLAVPSAKLTQRYAKVQNFTDLPDITLKQIEHFFAHYKDLEPGKWVKIVRWGDAEEARRLVREGVARAAAQSKA